MGALIVLALGLAGDIEWLASHEKALQKAKESGKPVLILAYDTT